MLSSNLNLNLNLNNLKTIEQISEKINKFELEQFEQLE